MDANERRILFKLWKDRHTHPGDELQEIEQRLIRVETGLDPLAATRSGAHIHLTGGSQTVDDEAVEWSSLFAAPLAFPTPSFPATEIEVHVPGYYPIYVHLAFDGWFGGGDVWVTRTRGGVTSQVWPPPGVTSLWSSAGGSSFTGLVPALEWQSGDVIQVWFDGGEEVTLSEAVVVPWLADRKPNSVAPPQDILVFTESGSHDFGSGGVFDMYLVAGGGGGGFATYPAGTGATGGGGGAGGVVIQTNVFISGVQEFTIGDGGLAAVDSSTPATDGEDSTFLGYTAVGGGRGGGGGNLAEDAGDGGSGGGGGPTPGSGTTGQGHGGGTRATPAITWIAIAGAGGGYGGPGEDGYLTKGGGAARGGEGLDLSEIVGTDYGNNGVFAEGGDTGGESLAHAPANSGNGGHGWSGSHGAGNGGSGILILVPKG